MLINAVRHIMKHMRWRCDIGFGVFLSDNLLNLSLIRMEENPFNRMIGTRIVMPEL